MSLKTVLQPISKKNIKEILDKLIIDFVDIHLNEKWKWRKGQKESIIEIIQTYLEGKYKVVILDAPTGSGKSIISLCVSWILNHYKLKGFILASDISLQNQYEEDIKKMNMPYGSVCGIDNYLCIDNMEKNSLGTCRIRNQSPKKYPCYNECPYFSNRDKATTSPTALLNYSYWMIMMNYVNVYNEEQIFPKRDFLICDEAHKIIDIVQNHFSPRFDKKTIDKLEKLTEFFVNHKINNHHNDFYNLKFHLQKIKKEEDKQELFKHLQAIEFNLSIYLKSITRFKDQIKAKYPKTSPPKDWRRAARLADWLKDIHCKVQDYNKIIDETSLVNLVKNPGIDDIVFNCLEEKYLMNNYFHKWSDFTLLMSATFSDPSEYLRSMALTGAKYIKLDDSFSFEKSPIYYYNKKKMNYNNIDKNLPWLIETINDILDNHINDNGIIHTSSYNLSLKIYQNLSHKNKSRCLIYNGTDEKNKMISILKNNNSKVLIGPSLTTGIDLKDDMARFSIIAKIPFPNLANNFIKTKMNINPNWYKWKTVIEIIQSIGRTIRNKNDWCITYILDASFDNLINYGIKYFSVEFIKRIKIK